MSLIDPFLKGRLVQMSFFRYFVLGFVLSFGLCEMDLFAQRPATPASTTPTTSSAAYQSRPVDDAEAAKLGQVTSLLKGTLDSDGQQTVNKFLTTYFFSRWTVESNMANLGQYRKELIDLVNESGGSGKDYILDRSARFLTAIAKSPQYYPACRYNAMLAVGTLDSGINNGRPVPYDKVLSELINTYKNKSNETIRDGVQESIRLAAFLGIMRHALLGITDVSLRDNEVIPLLIQVAKDNPHLTAKEGIVDEQDPMRIVVTTDPVAATSSEPHRSIQLHDWFRRRAVQALGMMANSPKEAEIVNDLLAIMKDTKEIAEIRYEAAFSLASYDLKALNINLEQVSRDLIELGIAACQDSRVYMAEQQASKQVLGTSASASSAIAGGTMSSSSYSSGTANNTTRGDAEIIGASIVRVKYGFSSILANIYGPTYRNGSGAGLSAATSSNLVANTLLTGLGKSLNDCIKYLDEGDPDAAKRAREAMAMSSDSYSSSSSSSTTASVSTDPNAPKVTMYEIDQQLLRVETNLTAILNSPTPTSTVPKR